jgi:hypothetical protein
MRNRGSHYALAATLVVFLALSSRPSLSQPARALGRLLMEASEAISGTRAIEFGAGAPFRAYGPAYDSIATSIRTNPGAMANAIDKHLSNNHETTADEIQLGTMLSQGIRSNPHRVAGVFESLKTLPPGRGLDDRDLHNFFDRKLQESLETPTQPTYLDAIKPRRITLDDPLSEKPLGIHASLRGVVPQPTANDVRHFSDINGCCTYIARDPSQQVSWAAKRNTKPPPTSLVAEFGDTARLTEFIRNNTEKSTNYIFVGFEEGQILGLLNNFPSISAKSLATGAHWLPDSFAKGRTWNIAKIQELSEAELSELVASSPNQSSIGFRAVKVVIEGAGADSPMELSIGAESADGNIAKLAPAITTELDVAHKQQKNVIECLLAIKSRLTEFTNLRMLAKEGAQKIYFSEDVGRLLGSVRIFA